MYKDMPESTLAMEIVKNQDLKLAIYKNMKTYAGSFVKQLAECLVLADSQNVYKLVTAFPGYFKEYLPENWIGESESEPKFSAGDTVTMRDGCKVLIAQVRMIAGEWWYKISQEAIGGGSSWVKAKYIDKESK